MNYTRLPSADWEKKIVREIKSWDVGREQNSHTSQEPCTDILSSLETIPHTTNAVWPQECLGSERRFGSREARLYALMDKRVTTPEGPGVLWRVFEGFGWGDSEQ